jgi:hypothetical protein
MTDAERLDWLEEFITREGRIMLHDGHYIDFGCSGIGLRPGYVNRTLREAIDQSAGCELER